MQLRVWKHDFYVFNTSDWCIEKCADVSSAMGNYQSKNITARYGGSELF